jgi:ribosomal 50S subunit-recycling heat shock protein
MDDEMSEAQRGSSTRARLEHSPLIRAGDVIEVWRQEDLLRIEVSGVAEQSGSMGETIRVRLLRPAGSNQSLEEQFSGVVRGRADVEMQP